MLNHLIWVVRTCKIPLESPATHIGVYGYKLEVFNFWNLSPELNRRMEMPELY